MENKGVAIYWFQCGDLVCNEEYIVETSRTFGERFKEHLKEPSPIHNHSYYTGHTTTQDNFQEIEREDHDIARTIKESIYITVNNPTLNRNIGKFNLHLIWDRILLNAPGLKIKGMHKILDMPCPPNLTPPCTFSQVLWSMLREHPCLSMHIEPPRTLYKVLNFSSPSGLMKSNCWLDESLFQQMFFSRESKYLDYVYLKYILYYSIILCAIIVWKLKLNHILDDIKL